MIIQADKINTNCTHEDIISEFCDRIQRKILKANEKGAHSICFYESPIRWDDYEQKFKWATDGRPYFHFDNYRDEIAAKFLAAGYKIKPTGYIGGVLQLTEDIYW